MHLLIIDDNASLVRALERLFSGRKDLVFHGVTYVAEAHSCLKGFEIEAILLDHDLVDDRSQECLTLLQKDFPHLIPKTWLMYGALELSRWTPEDQVGIAGILVKPHELSRLVPWVDQLRNTKIPISVTPFLKSFLSSGLKAPIDVSPPSKLPSSPFQELEWALKDRGAWHVEVAILLETLEEKINKEQAQSILEAWNKKRPIV